MGKCCRSSLQETAAVERRNPGRMFFGGLDDVDELTKLKELHHNLAIGYNIHISCPSPQSLLLEPFRTKRQHAGVDSKIVCSILYPVSKQLGGVCSLQAAALSTGLHSSSSGIDLPMKAAACVH